MGGFGIVGIPENGVFALMDMGVKDLNIVSNLAGTKFTPSSFISYLSTTNEFKLELGIAEWGIGLMLKKNQVKAMFASYVGENPVYEKQYLSGNIDLNLIPQGTLAEKLRMGAAGVPAFYVKAGVGTYVETGGFPVRLGADGKSVAKISKPKERRFFNGRDFLLEEAIKVDYAMAKVCKHHSYIKQTSRRIKLTIKEI